MNTHLKRIRANRHKRAKPIIRWAHRLKEGRTRADNKAFVELLKHRPTQAELRVCSYLKELKIKYVFQKRLGPFVADFWLKSRHLVLEVDGSSHDGRGEYDAWRDAWCRAQGFTVLRITNNQTVSIGAFIKAIPWNWQR